MESPTSIIQVTNVAPDVRLDQMTTFFRYVGNVLDIKIYPSVDSIIQSASKVCYVRFAESWSVGVAQHLTNTVFNDRALVIVPFLEDAIPDETRAMTLTIEIASISNMVASPPGSSQQVTVGDASQNIQTADPLKSEDIQRTIYVENLDPTVTAKQLMEFFGLMGEIKYLRMAGDEQQPTRSAFVEFSNQIPVGVALQYNEVVYGTRPMQISRSTIAIVKSQVNSDVTQRATEEAMKRVLEAESLIASAVEPELDEKKNDRSRSTSRSRRRLRSTSRRSNESRSRKRSTSRSRRRSVSRSRRRSVSRSRRRNDSRSRRRSVSRTRRRSRSRSCSSKRSRRRRSRHRSRSRRRRSKSTGVKSESRQSSRMKKSETSKSPSCRSSKPERQFRSPSEKSISPVKTQSKCPKDKSGSSVNGETRQAGVRTSVSLCGPSSGSQKKLRSRSRSRKRSRTPAKSSRRRKSPSASPVRRRSRSPGRRRTSRSRSRVDSRRRRISRSSRRRSRSLRRKSRSPSYRRRSRSPHRPKTRVHRRRSPCRSSRSPGRRSRSPKNNNKRRSRSTSSTRDSGRKKRKSADEDRSQGRDRKKIKPSKETERSRQGDQVRGVYSSSQTNSIGDGSSPTINERNGPSSQVGGFSPNSETNGRGDWSSPNKNERNGPGCQVRGVSPDSEANGERGSSSPSIKEQQKDSVSNPCGEDQSESPVDKNDRGCVSVDMDLDSN